MFCDFHLGAIYFFGAFSAEVLEVWGEGGFQEGLHLSCQMLMVLPAWAHFKLNAGLNFSDHLRSVNLGFKQHGMAYRFELAKAISFSPEKGN